MQSRRKYAVSTFPFEYKLYISKEMKPQRSSILHFLCLPLDSIQSNHNVLLGSQQSYGKLCAERGVYSHLWPAILRKSAAKIRRAQRYGYDISHEG